MSEILRAAADLLNPQTDKSNGCPMINPDGTCGFTEEWRERAGEKGPSFVNSKGQCVADRPATIACALHMEGAKANERRLKEAMDRIRSHGITLRFKIG